MRLLSFSCRDFRNLEPTTLVPSTRATVAVGQNGQGKTNLLEAIYFLVTLKPLRATRLSELVRFGAGATRVSGTFELRGAQREIAVEVSQGQRQAFVDGKKATTLDEYFGGAAVVAFTPDDLEVVKGSPEGRRAFLDRAVWNRFPAYLAETRSYARALKGRNRLLKDRADSELISAWDDGLARAGTALWIRRRSLMAELAPRAVAAFDAIGRTPEPAQFFYAPNGLKLPDDCPFSSVTEAQLRGRFLERLAERLPRDLDRGFTSLGPHADDLALSVGEKAARSFASQGQQRALILAWKVAEIENLSDSLGFLPLLLLDDVSSELDPERNAYLMEYLAHSQAQALLTTTDRQMVARGVGLETVWCQVQSGQIRVEK